MRFMILVPANKDSEAGKMPDERGLTLMAKYNEELVKAGVMLEAEGLHPTSRASRVTFDGARRTVVDGPFTESKELIAGYGILRCASREEAVEWVKRAPFGEVHDHPVQVEIRQIFEPADFAASDPTGEVGRKRQELREAASRLK